MLDTFFNMELVTSIINSITLSLLMLDAANGIGTTKKCLQCSFRWVYNSNNVCVPVSDFCSTFNKETGACTACFTGYDLVNGGCVFSASNTAKPTDLGCGQWDWNAQKCLKCSFRWSFNSYNQCVPVSDNCQTWDNNGNCLACYKGYGVNNGACYANGVTKPTDLGCGKWDWDNQKCLSCSYNWVFNANRVCTPVSSQCASSDAYGNCLTCYVGYVLQYGACNFDYKNNNAKPSDVGCGQWDWNNQRCLQCSFRWVYNSNNVCVPVSDFCSTFNKETGACTACFTGYDLVNGGCVFSASNTAKPTDLGCGQWDWNAQKCLKCSFRWSFNSYNQCVPVSDNCQTWDNNGNCLACYKGYGVNNGACYANGVTKPTDLGCGKWDWDNQKCLSCSYNWVFNANRVCTPVSSQCASSDSNGNCLTCYVGYVLQYGACNFDYKLNNAKPSDVGCGKWDWNNQRCLQCSFRWVYNSNNVCVPVSDFCSTFNKETGACTACFTGYDLINGGCIFSASNTAKPTDLGCGQWDWNAQKCLKCSFRWSFNSYNQCVPVSDNCQTWDNNGNCLTCYKGYGVNNGACYANGVTKPTDLGCGKWDWDNQKCLSCSYNWVFDAKGVCTPVSSQCASSDSNGNCLTCYVGYVLQYGACNFDYKFNNAKPADVGCGQWDWVNQKCLQCSFKWVFNQNRICVPVSDFCSTFNKETGACTACFTGYDLVNGGCVFSASNTAKPTDLGCGQWDWNAQKCLKCSFRWSFNSYNQCVPVSDNCQTWDNNGNCLACYKGYGVNNGACYANGVTKPTDLGCGKWDWDNQKCLSCSYNWVFNANRVCTPVSSQCASSDSNGNCLTCYVGYVLQYGACNFDYKLNNAKPSDVGCGKWDWNNQRCLQCSFRWVYNSNNVCVPVSDFCSTFNKETGACTACFTGYDLVNGGCVFSASNTAKPTDLGCGQWDWNAQKCLKCSFRWSFNSYNQCVPVSDNCQTWDNNGNCLACYKGYGVNNGACYANGVTKPTDLGCGKWDWDNQKCLSCSYNWVFNANRVCTPVSSQCASSDSNGNCLTCYVGYVLQYGACNFDYKLNNAKPSDVGCGKWDWNNQRCLQCSFRWVYNSNNVCVPVSDFCSTFNKETGACTACFTGYDLVNGGCVFSASNTAKPTDLGCGQWDWNAQKCLKCSFRWSFNSYNQCVPVSDNCQTWDNNGNCLACYKGYGVNNGACYANGVTKPTDLGCGKWDWDNQKCLSCSYNWVFNANGVCTPVSSQCASSDSNGNCLTCYVGYVLQYGACNFDYKFNNAKPADVGCGKWDWNNQRCLQCSFRWVYNSNNVCVPVSDFCSTFNKETGACTACFTGYDLVNGGCVFSASNTAKPTDLGCGQWDWNAQKCLKCSFRWSFNSYNQCVPVSDNCQTWDNNGNCLACYKGYGVNNGACYANGVTKPTDLGCGKWDWDNQKCLSCSYNWVFNANKVCTPVSSQCASSDAYGNCLTCYVGYVLQYGACNFDYKLNNAKPSDVGCGKWDWNNQRCLQCSFRWVYNSNNVCVPVSDFCSTFNKETGACTACFTGYDLVNGGCVFSASNTAKPTDLGCGQWDWNAQKCLKCSFRWSFNSYNQCVPVSDNCQTWDNNGNCLACYKGYGVNNGACYANGVTKPTDLGCGKWDWDNQKCLSCSYNWVFNANRVCTPVSSQCASSDAYGNCLTCYVGYVLQYGACNFDYKLNNAKPSDVGCGKWDWNNQRCLQCSFRWVYNSNNVCVPVSDFCSTFNKETGACTACFTGYDLVNGGCVFSASNTAKPTDLGCGQWDWNAQKCLKCSFRWSFNSYNQCVPVSDNCQTWDNNGNCLACYKGYGVNNGACYANGVTKPTDLGCGKWDWDNQKCLSCSYNWVFNANRVCTPVSSQCASSDSNGNCLTCYVGYVLQYGVCNFDYKLNNAKPSDLGCGQWDWNNQRCLQCSFRWVFNQDHVCVPVNDFCSTWDNITGACVACFKGYTLSNGACNLTPTQAPTDLGCAVWDWDNQKCLNCSQWYVFDSNYVCQPVSPNCQTFDSVSGQCNKCYKGYNLVNGSCVLAPPVNPGNPGCAQWDWNNLICLKCSVRYVFSTNNNTLNLCIPVNDNCKSFNTLTGLCSYCYQGYDLTDDGKCVYSQSNLAPPKDLGCANWDWNKQICLACSNKWVFVNGVCAQVDPLCANNDAYGACTSCYKGYSLVNGKCQVSNSLCNVADQNGACLTCYNGYVLYKNQCQSISSLASLYLYYSQCCPQKLAALQAQAGNY